MRAMEFAKALKAEYKRDKVNDIAAALTYYGLLALFPFLLALVGLAALVIDPAQMQQLVQQLSTVAPPAATQIIGGQLQQLSGSGGGGVFTFGFLLALWSASNGIMAAIRAFNTAWEVEEDSRGFLRLRALAIAATLLTAALLIVAALVAVATPAVAGFLGEPLGTIFTWARLPVAALLMAGLLAVLYWALPDAKQPFKLITPGAIFAVVVWTLASWLFSLYVKNFSNYNATYGALGGVIVLLLWMWISAIVVVLGAEINSLVQRGRRTGRDVSAVPSVEREGLPPHGKAEVEEKKKRKQPPSIRREEEEPRTLH